MLGFKQKMTVEKAKKIISEIRYKPSWVFGIYGDPKIVENYGPRVYLNITSETTDAVNETKTTNLKAGKWMDFIAFENLTKQDLIKWIEEVIREKELHEFKEWFRYKGKQVHNPHPKNK